MENNKRRFSLDEDFMKFDTDDLVYGFMRSISTAEPDPQQQGKYREYLTKKKFQEEKKVIAGICGCSAQTIKNRIDKLVQKGLIKEGEVTTTNKQGKEYTYPCYFFPYNYDGIYKIIEQEMVAYLVHTRNAQAIRIYLYLLNCSTFKDDYVFTIKEIKKALGYAESTKSADKVISNVLESFEREGLIRVDEEWFPCIDNNGMETYTQRKILRFIATSKQQF